MTRVATILGTMEMGRGRCVNGVPAAMVSSFLGYDGGANFGAHTELDTAFMYCDGKTEEILGGIEDWKVKGSMATKVNRLGDNSLSEASIRTQLATSLKRLRADSVKILYLHHPDHQVALEETLGAIDKLHKEGKFQEFGLSNFSSWLVAEIVNKCKTNNWITPTVYQGMYSAVTRQVEPELFPCLRYYGIRFYAYSPLGGGVLTGKHKFEQFDDMSIATGRFNGIGWDKVYRERYWKREHFEAIEKLKELLVKHHEGENVTVAEAAIRWIYNHSVLDGSKGDGVILGSSSLEQLEANLSYASKGPLADEVVKFYDDWWACTKHLCPDYFR